MVLVILQTNIDKIFLEKGSELLNRNVNKFFSSIYKLNIKSIN